MLKLFENRISYSKLYVSLVENINAFLSEIKLIYCLVIRKCNSLPKKNIGDTEASNENIKTIKF